MKRSMDGKRPVVAGFGPHVQRTFTPVSDMPKPGHNSGGRARTGRSAGSLGRPRVDARVQDHGADGGAVDEEVDSAPVGVENGDPRY